MGFMIAGLGLFKSLDLPGDPLQPNHKPMAVLVYGGSTATGTAAIQLLKLAGYSAIVTCSAHNFELVKSYGADIAFDYRLSTCAADIGAQTKNSLCYALDCISTSQSMDLCYAALGRAGGRYTALSRTRRESPRREGSLSLLGSLAPLCSGGRSTGSHHTTGPSCRIWPCLASNEGILCMSCMIKVLSTLPLSSSDEIRGY